MKKALAMLAAVLTVAPSAVFAKGGSLPMGGCGLGYELLGKNENTPVMQSLSITTNVTGFNNLFGISSGTSGCTSGGRAAISKETERFVEINFDELRSDIARGQGEYVNGLVSLMGVKEVKRNAAVLLMKKDYADLFPSEEMRFDDFLRNLQRKFSDNIELVG